MASGCLRIRVKCVTASEFRGVVADDDGPSPMLREGTEAKVFLNPPGTHFEEASIIGSGRIYDDRVEIDLCLRSDLVAKLVDSAPLMLEMTTSPLTETIFRVRNVENWGKAPEI